MTPEPKLNEQLTDDLAVQGASEDDHASSDADSVLRTGSNGEADETDEAQGETAEERKDGGYQ